MRSLIRTALHESPFEPGNFRRVWKARIIVLTAYIIAAFAVGALVVLGNALLNEVTA